MLKLLFSRSTPDQTHQPCTRFNLLLAIWLGLVLNFAFYQKIHQLTPYTNLKAGALLAATVLVIIGLYNLVLQWLNWKWNAKILASVLIILGGLVLIFVNSLGVLTADQIQNMLQTDARESVISGQYDC